MMKHETVKSPWLRHCHGPSRSISDLRENREEILVKLVFISVSATSDGISDAK